MSGLLCWAAGLLTPGASKEHTVFIFRGQSVGSPSANTYLQVQKTGIKIVNVQKIHRKLSHDWKKVFTKSLLVMAMVCGHIRIYW
jgi:hypothetical protein